MKVSGMANSVCSVATRNGLCTDSPTPWNREVVRILKSWNLVIGKITGSSDTLKVFEGNKSAREMGVLYGEKGEKRRTTKTYSEEEREWYRRRWRDNQVKYRTRTCTKNSSPILQSSTMIHAHVYMYMRGLFDMVYTRACFSGSPLPLWCHLGLQ